MTIWACNACSYENSNKHYKCLVRFFSEPMIQIDDTFSLWENVEFGRIHNFGTFSNKLNGCY